MKLNLFHIKSLGGILKIAGLVIGIIAASLGASAFVNSPYNKSCRDSEPFLPSSSGGSTMPSNYSTATTQRTREPISTTVNTRLQTDTSSSSTASTPVGQSSTTGNPDENEVEKDMAPVLWMERAQISMTCITVIISAGLLLGCLLSEDLEYGRIFKSINFGFHFLGCILLIISAIFLAFAAIEIDNKICSDERFTGDKEDCQKYKQKMSAAGFTLLQAVLYAAISVQIIGPKLYEEV